ncbi:MAG: transglycosylase SLT domain-containing protein, partial [Pseudomonadota bacterium]
MRIGPIRVSPVARESIRLLVGGVVASVALAGCQTLHDTPATGTILSHYTTPTHGHLPGFEGAPAYTPEVPAVAPEASEATAKVVAEPDLWADMRNNMHLDKYLNEKRVQQEIRWIQKHPGYLPRLQQRMQRYLPYIYTQTQLRSLPAELALLPIVESALDTFAFSHGGAAGPWQFVRGTARQYGLEINSWYD